MQSIRSVRSATSEEFWFVGRGRGRGLQISTDLSAIERRVGLACVVAKLNKGDSRKKPPPKGSGTIVKHRILLLYYLKD